MVKSRKARKLTEEHKRRIGESNKKANPATWYTYICAFCSKEFSTRSKNRKYCCLKCYHSHGIQCICVRCGKKFKASAHNTKYCNNCLMRVCERCGKSFMVSSGEFTRKYCSTNCYHASTVGKVAWNKNYIQVECQFCGKEFEVPSVRRETVKYCSMECKHNALSERTGEKHPLWKGGFTLYGRLLSQNEGSFYRNRIKVLNRDEHTCCRCGFKGPSWYMDVHHIIPVREFGSNSEDNMITLCRKCHNKADRGKISRQVLFQYISGNAYESLPVRFRRTNFNTGQRYSL